MAHGQFNVNMETRNLVEISQKVSYIPFEIMNSVTGKFGILVRVNDNEPQVKVASGNQSSKAVEEKGLSENEYVFFNGNTAYSLEYFPMYTTLDVLSGLTENGLKLIAIEDISEESALWQNIAFTAAFKRYMNDY